MTSKTFNRVKQYQRTLIRQSLPFSHFSLVFSSLFLGVFLTFPWCFPHFSLVFSSLFLGVFLTFPWCFSHFSLVFFDGFFRDFFCKRYPLKLFTDQWFGRYRCFLTWKVLTLKMSYFCIIRKQALVTFVEIQKLKIMS